MRYVIAGFIGFMIVYLAETAPKEHPNTENQIYAYQCGDKEYHYIYHRQLSEYDLEELAMTNKEAKKILKQFNKTVKTVNDKSKAVKQLERDFNRVNDDITFKEVVQVVDGQVYFIV